MLEPLILRSYLYKKEMNTISWHNIVLKDEGIRLRPFVESDWELLFKWCNDPEVLYYSDGLDVKGYDLALSREEYFQINRRSS